MFRKTAKHTVTQQIMQEKEHQDDSPQSKLNKILISVLRAELTIWGSVQCDCTLDVLISLPCYYRDHPVWLYNVL